MRCVGRRVGSWAGWGAVRVLTMVQVAAAAMLNSWSAWRVALIPSVLGSDVTGFFDACVGCVRCGARGLWCTG